MKNMKQVKALLVVLFKAHFESTSVHWAQFKKRNGPFAGFLSPWYTHDVLVLKKHSISLTDNVMRGEENRQALGPVTPALIFLH